MRRIRTRNFTIYKTSKPTLSSFNEDSTKKTATVSLRKIDKITDISSPPWAINVIIGLHIPWWLCLFSSGFQDNPLSTDHKVSLKYFQTRYHDRTHQCATSYSWPLETPCSHQHLIAYPVYDPPKQSRDGSINSYY